MDAVAIKIVPFAGQLRPTKQQPGRCYANEWLNIWRFFVKGMTTRIVKKYEKKKMIITFFSW